MLTSLLSSRQCLRRFEFGEERRAGFCLIGSCQDCWVRRTDGASLHACTTLVKTGMALLTGERDNA